MAAATSATSRASTGEVRPVPKGSRIVPSRAIDSAGPFQEEGILEEDRGPEMHDGKPGPVQTPARPANAAAAGESPSFRSAHLRHGHLEC